MADWENYYKKHATRKPREQVVKAVTLCVEKDHALDIGAGALVESAYLLTAGFKKVTAIDSSDQARVYAKELESERFLLQTCSYQDFDFQKDTYNLVCAFYSLPFNGPNHFEKLIEDIKLSLKPGGIFCGQLFGTLDGFNTPDTKLVFHTKEEVLQLLHGLEMIECEEIESDSMTIVGKMKHWHVFHFMLRKADGSPE